MKVYKYETKVYESMLDWKLNSGEMQQRVFIWGLGVLGYRENKWKEEGIIDFFFFSTSKIAPYYLKPTISGANLKSDVEHIMGYRDNAGNRDKSNYEYQGYELPDPLVEELTQKIVDANDLLRFRNAFGSGLEKSGGDLVSLVENSSNPGRARLETFLTQGGYGDESVQIRNKGV